MVMRVPPSRSVRGLGGCTFVAAQNHPPSTTLNPLILSILQIPVQTTSHHWVVRIEERRFP